MRSVEQLFKLAVDILNEREAPEWLRKHPEIAKRKRIEKAFSHFGISSFRDPARLDTSTERNDIAEKLLLNIIDIFADVRNTLLEVITAPELTVDLLAKVNSLCDLITIITFQFNKSDLTLSRNAQSGKYVLLKNDTLFKAYSKITKWLHELQTAFRAVKINIDLTIPPIDTLPLAKEFHKINMPNKTYWVVFNADEQGVWDVCTMSMRGISSCQKWDFEMEPDNSPGLQGALVGSVLSKYIGVIYLTSGRLMELGEKMLKRCVVRIVRHKHTKAPYIVVDRMYDSFDPEVMKLFINSLQSRTSLKVLDFASSHASITQNTTQPEIDPSQLERRPERPMSNLKYRYQPYYDTSIARSKPQPTISAADLIRSIRQELPNLSDQISATYRDKFNIPKFPTYQETLNIPDFSIVDTWFLEALDALKEIEGEPLYKMNARFVGRAFLLKLNKKVVAQGKGILLENKNLPADKIWSGADIFMSVITNFVNDKLNNISNV